jgi:glycosyltransferase involved in cell wall biosynthesis
LSGDSRLRQLGDAYREGGLRGAASTVGAYLAWKAQGSPGSVGTPISDETQRIGDLESVVGVLLMRDWYAAADPTSTPLVSVILPTKDRPALLQRSVRSVISQSYPNWELLVIDDAETPSEPVWTGEAADQRLRRLASGGRGVAAARNVGLDNASGDMILFVDDDNVMDRHWIKSAVLGFEAASDARVIVGAQMVMPERGQTGPPTLRLPSTFDWETLTRYNFVDMGMLAQLPDSEIRFDETLPAFVDWDYVVRLTLGNQPAIIPALSGIYLTDAPNRISFGDRRRLQQELQSRFASLRAGSPSHESRISLDDLATIEVLLHNKAAASQGAIEILEVGEPRVSIALAGRRDLPDINWVILDEEDERISEVFDVIVVDNDDPTIAVDEALGPHGLVIGLDAHRSAYDKQYPSLTHQRRIGDALWVGSEEAQDLESLVPPAALINLGYDSPADPARVAGTLPPATD